MDVAKISVVGIPDKPGIAASIFRTAGQSGIALTPLCRTPA